MTTRHVVIAMIVVAATAVHADVGSPDVFVETEAGPYHLFVTVRPPEVIPGVADVEILATGSRIDAVRIVPAPLTGPAAQFTPTPDRAVRSEDDPQRFSGHLWIMTAGAWQVRVTVDGERGSGAAGVPIPALPHATKEMSRGLAAGLFGLMLVLCVGVVSIVSAIAREASLAPGEDPGPHARRRGRIAAVVATLIVAAVVGFGNWWWTAEASAYARYVYKPLQAMASVADGRLTLTLRDPGWIPLRRLDDFVPDHGHVMHLFVLSPELDRLWHLHPRQAGTAIFEQRLPDVARGSYEFFADVVHATGIAETVTGRAEVAQTRGVALDGDDSVWSAPAPSIEPEANSYRLADGGRMVWIRDAQPLRTKQLTLFTFRVDDAAGQPAGDLELYMGMPGHAVFVRRDRQVFAHVHPSGSAPMATLQMSQRWLDGATAASSPAASHMHTRPAPPATISFPFGFPQPGDYRIYVQVKRAGRIETGAFDAHVQ